MQDINIFYDKSTKILSYRKKELSILFKHAQTQSTDDEISNTLFRAFILLLYAHLEWTTKDLAKLFFEYLNSQNLNFNKINHIYYLNYIKRQFDAWLKSSDIKKPQDKAFFLYWCKDKIKHWLRIIFQNINERLLYKFLKFYI